MMSGACDASPPPGRRYGCGIVILTPSIPPTIWFLFLRSLVSPGMDSTSLFHDKAPGANDAAASLTAILVAVSALATSGLPLATLPKNIVVGLFQVYYM